MKNSLNDKIESPKSKDEVKIPSDGNCQNSFANSADQKEVLPPQELPFFPLDKRENISNTKKKSAYSQASANSLALSLKTEGDDSRFSVYECIQSADNVKTNLGPIQVLSTSLLTLGFQKIEAEGIQWMQDTTNNVEKKLTYAQASGEFSTFRLETECSSRASVYKGIQRKQDNTDNVKTNADFGQASNNNLLISCLEKKGSGSFFLTQYREQSALLETLGSPSVMQRDESELMSDNQNYRVSIDNVKTNADFGQASNNNLLTSCLEKKGSGSFF